MIEFYLEQEVIFAPLICTIFCLYSTCNISQHENSHGSCYLQHSVGCPGARAPEPGTAVLRSRVPAGVLPARHGQGTSRTQVTQSGVPAQADLHHRPLRHHGQRGCRHLERYPPQDRAEV